MILDEHQYKVTLEQIQKFKLAVQQVKASPESEDSNENLKRKTHLESLSSQLEEIRAEVAVYEKANPQKYAVNIDGEMGELVNYLARSQGISLEETFRKAIATEAYLYQRRQEDNKIFLFKPGGEPKELYFR